MSVLFLCRSNSTLQSTLINYVTSPPFHVYYISSQFSLFCCITGTAEVTISSNGNNYCNQLNRYAMNIDPELKMCRGSKIEKHVLREAFDDKEDPFLPSSVLWRQKEQGRNSIGSRKSSQTTSHLKVTKQCKSYKFNFLC